MRTTPFLPTGDRSEGMTEIEAWAEGVGGYDETPGPRDSRGCAGTKVEFGVVSGQSWGLSGQRELWVVL